MALALPALGLRASAQAPGLHLQLDGGRASLSLTGVVNTRYAVQYTGDLSQPHSWQLLTNVVLPSSPYVLADPGVPAAAQRFYRAVTTNLTITVTDAQLQDLCSRACDSLTLNSRIPETVTLGGANTNTVSAAELYHLMVKWLRHYKNHGSQPPATVAIAERTRPPGPPSGVESGTMYLADILAAAETAAASIETNNTLPDGSAAGAVQYTTRAMFSVFARTINWYQDHGATMPAYATVKAVAAPDSWSSGLRVAVFSDASTMVECVNATLDILRTNAGFNASTISAATIKTAGLSGYDVVMFPGGSGSGQAQALGQTGCARVEQFVANGGGYIGTCAGAYLAILGYGGMPETSWLDLVDAQLIDFEHWSRGQGWAQVQLVNRTHPIVSGCSEFITVQYINGPLLGPGNSPALLDYEPEAVFVTDIHDNAPAGIMPGTTCMTCSRYGSGRCVLFSFHPELSPGFEPLDVRAVKWAAGKL